MKQLICEMCGSTDLVKQDGVFVCQSCGTKYTVEEAKKMMVEGTVRIDASEKLGNLYTLARQAKESNDAENAAKYYDLIKQEDPNSWEAYFYNVYFRAAQTRIMFIQSAADSINNSLGIVFDLIKNSPDNDEDKKAHALEVSLRVELICTLLEASSKSTFVDSYNRALSVYDSKSMMEYASEYANRALTIVDTMFTCGNLIEQRYNADSSMMERACSLWKSGIDIWKNIYALYDNHTLRYSDMKRTYVAKLQKYENNYVFTAPQYTGFPAVITTSLRKHSNSDFGINNTSASTIAPTKTSDSAPASTSGSTTGGCYVATAVYGSYDCPRVWTLRRYRDYTLAETWYGRAFVRAYYAISPTLVRWFGHTEWFKKMWKGRLDRMVANLNAEGVEDTPYVDQEW